MSKAAAEKVTETAQKVTESETVQKGLEVAKQKAQALAESETVQKGVEYGQVAVEKAAVGAGVVKEAAKGTAGVVGQVWSNGKGELKRAKAALKSGSFTGSAKTTLDMEQRAEEWAKFKVKGCEEVTVSARNEYTTSYQLQPGWTLQWTFRVQSLDIGFALRRRVMADGGSVEEVILPSEKCDDTETITGSWTATEASNCVVAFDNSYSMLRSKNIA